MNLRRLYSGRLRLRDVASLVAELPPGAAIYRGSDLDSRIYSLEAALLRVLVNLHLDKKDQLPTVEQAVERAQRDQQRKAKAERMLARQRARAQEVSRG